MKIHIVKIGGNLIIEKKLLLSSLESFLLLPGNKILIHGGGSKANILSEKMGLIPKFIQGRRITDKETLDLLVMTYAGMINKNIVALLQSYDCNALGLCGADGNCLKSFFRLKTNNIDYGYVGDITSKSVNTYFIKSLLKKNIVPVLCPITHNGKGDLLNTNADTIAAYIAISLTKDCNDENEIELHFCFDKKGVLRDLHDAESYFQRIDFRLFQRIKNNHTIKNGMIPKLENAFLALRNGVSKVSIGNPLYLNEENNKTILCL
ncbi:MAG: acetylglutamate kinase [Flavobacteriales bacterium]|jgi:acetylglutamate kinase|uniref:acetylglutamate kinase n=1 Tax=Blattabacterium sp. (Mastotermes darwiniensis) TaxID=39768 RepID=UPI000231DF63|nr:acetylglutamate kinase [Blattabacterium sp. (Mastotermes darwiniensis)]AER40379.1 acetylglutamate kinase [Blattabacterium sp. (Mastotermes darwiniensis) str. MADAR]MDR1804900.1 acetylglutamate kinase [Flavobacteriales bacterium]